MTEVILKNILYLKYLNYFSYDQNLNKLSLKCCKNISKVANNFKMHHSQISNYFTLIMNQKSI
jgi:hypothetical protein